MSPTAFATVLLLFAAHAVRAEFFVSDFNNHVVLRYNETNGAFIDVFVPNTNGLLLHPHGLAFGPDGHLYVASAGNDTVLRYDGTTGAFMDVFIGASAGLDYPVRLIFGPDGLLYVSSQLNDRVLRFDAITGSFVDVFVTNSVALDGPSDMTFGPEEDLYVVGRFNNCVARFDGSSGEFVEWAAATDLSQPFGVRFGLTHDLLVVSGNDNRIQRFSGGAFGGTFASAGGLGLPVGIVHGPDGNLYVASYGNAKVVRYDSVSGAYLGDFIGAGSGGLSGPNFMAFRPPVGPAPALNIVPIAGGADIMWPARCLPAVFQESEGLDGANWGSSSNIVSVVSSSNRVFVPFTGSSRFFRLRLLE